MGRPLSRLEFYQVECLTPVGVTQIPPEFPSLHEALLFHVWQSQQMLSIINQHRIINRLWYLLEWLASRFGRAIPGGISLNLYLTHQDMAETINTSRVRLSELLSQLEREGKIKRTRRNLILTRVTSGNQVRWDEVGRPPREQSVTKVHQTKEKLNYVWHSWCFWFRFIK